MDSIESIGLFFDCQHFIDSIDPSAGSDCAVAYERWVSTYAPKCVAPNKEFDEHPELLYRISATGEKECNLDKWLKPISESIIKKLIKPYLFCGDTKEKEYKTSLLKKNINVLAKHHPSDLEKLLDFNSTTVRIWTLNGLESNSDHEVSPETLEYLKKTLGQSTDGNYTAKLIEPAAKILTNYITHYEKGHTHTDFLTDLIKCESCNDDVRKIIFEKFTEDVSGVKNWENGKFDRFALLLEHDSSDHSLAQGLFSAQKYHGYTSSMDLMPDFEKLLEEEGIKDAAAGFIAKSLEKLLREPSTDNDFSTKVGKVEPHIINLQNKTGKLALGLVDAIFDVYKKDQSHFNDLIVNLIAEDKLLPRELLGKLVDPLVKIKDPKTALFIATRLTQHYIELPSETLKYFIQFLNDKDKHISSLAINLYYQKLTKIPVEISTELVEALLVLLPTSGELQHSKIGSILDRINLDAVQSLKREIQDEVFGWHKADTLEAKTNISTKLHAKISSDTAKELILFFKEHLLSQNTQLMEIAHSAFAEIEQDESMDLGEADETEGIFEECSFGDEVKFLLNAQQLQNLKDAINGSFWKYIERISFTDIKELNGLLDFIKINQLSEAELKRALGENLSIAGLYSNLLQGLIADIEKQPELSQSNKKALKISVEYLVDEVNWPTDFLFRLIKNAEQGSFIKLVSVLEKLADYKVSPEAIDREGITTLEMLKSMPIGKLSQSISRAINDNHFYISKNIDTLLEGIKQSNPNNARLLGLINDGYFVEQLLKIQYEFEISNIEPTAYEPNKLYLYKEGDAFYLATNSKKKLFAHLTLEQFEQLNELIENKSLSTKEVEEFIYKQAVKLGITPESRDITPVLRGSSKPLSAWEADDFLKWRQTITKIDDGNIAEVIAVLSQAAHNMILEKKWYPRAIQIISILSLFKSTHGGLAQIATGEGKSLILACFAIIKVLEQGSEGRPVDIVTSSSILAKRDVEELESFYGQFGVSVSHNVEEGGWGKPKDCYATDVVYGDLLYFIGDTLRDESADTKQGRGLDTLIVDEVDNMVIDQNDMKVQLSGTIPGCEVLGSVLVYVRGTASLIAPQLVSEENECYVKVPVISEAQKNTTDFDPNSFEQASHEMQLVPIGPSCTEYLKYSLTNYTQENLLAFDKPRAERFVKIPRHLEKFANDQVPKWMESMIFSYLHEEKFSYVVYKNPDKNARYPFPNIAPIDYENTGVIQHGLQWSDGLHQFLQIKHGVTLYPENVVSIFMSYFGFFSKYHGNIYGVTGTLGEESHHKFLKEVYKVELSVIPAFIEKDLTEFRSIVVGTKSQWREEIADVIERKIAGLRAGLVVVETIAEVESLKAYLKDSGYDHKKLFVYGTGGKNEYKVEKKRALQPGEVVIATNMAGRGTDLKISSEVKKNGGLHVIMGSFSESVRVQDQGYGRAARQGEPGSAQIIVNIQEVRQTDCTEDIECLKKERHAKEIQKLEEDRICNLPRLGIRDKLFNLFLELKKEIDSPTHYKLIVGNADIVEPRSLYLYKEGSSINLKIVQGNTNGELEPFDITELLNTIDPRATKHIRTILSDDTHSSSSLNKQDYEIIHFIAAVKGYTKFPEIYNRVKLKFNEVVERERQRIDTKLFKSDKTAYLAMLLKNDTQYADLYKGDPIEDVAFEKAEMRKQYSLWVADRALYNNMQEIRQVTDYWGIWLKQHDYLFERPINCTINNEMQIKATFELLFEELKVKFGLFRDEVEKKEAAGELMSNIHYLVLKAWQYFNIALKPNAIPHKAKPQESSEGWFGYVESFINGVKEYMGYKRVIIGGENYDPKTPLVSAISLLMNATAIDNIHSWTADNAMSVIRLVKDGQGISEVKQEKEAAEVKKNYYRDISEAISKIEEHDIPAIDSVITFILINKMVDPHSDLLIQMYGTKEVFLKLVSTLDKNRNVVISASGKEMIRLGQPIPPEEWASGINITDVILKSANRTGDIFLSGQIYLKDITKFLNVTGTEIEFTSKQYVLDQIASKGGYIFGLETFKLEEEKRDWGATIFAAVVAIASIYTGLWMINMAASSIFLSALGTSLVVQGVGDIVQSIVAVGTGNPIDFDNYIKAKGMATGISLATAGVLHFASTIPFINNLGYLQTGADNIFNAAQDPSKFLTTTFSIQAATMATGAALQNVGKNLVNPEAIEAEAKEAIEEVVESHRDTLNRIYITDALNGNTLLQDSLYEQAGRVVSKYNNRFHDDKIDFGEGVTTNVVNGFFPGAGTALNTGAKVATGMVKNSQAMRKITKGIKAAIENTGARALSSSNMLEILLSREFGPQDGTAIFEALKTQGYVPDGEIKYQQCSMFGEVQLIGEMLTKAGERIVKSCKDVVDLLLKQRDYEGLRNHLAGFVSKGIAAIQRNEVVRPFTQFASGEIGAKAGTWTANFVHDKLKKPTGSGSGDKPKVAEDRTSVNKQEEAARKGLEKQTTARKGPSQEKVPNGDKIETGTDQDAQNVYNDFAKKVEELGIFGSENAEAVSRTMYIESNGKKYVVFAEGTRIYGEDGSTVIKEEILLDAIEMKSNTGIKYKTETSIPVNGADFEKTYNRFSLLISNDKVTNTKNLKFVEFKNEAESAWNWDEGFSPVKFGPDMPHVGPKVSILDNSVTDTINLDFSTGTEKIVINGDRVLGEAQKQEPLPQARIEIRTKNVKNTQLLGTINDWFGAETKGAPQHLFIIHVDSTGQETIIRGGPAEYMLLDDIKIIKAPYGEIQGKVSVDYVKNAPHMVIAEGSDAEIKIIVDKMWSRAEEINREGYDYKLPFLGYVQNSNTVVRHLVEYAGLEFKLPKHNDGSNILAPGVESSGFKHTQVDQILSRAGEFTEWYIKEFKVTPKTAREVFIAYLRSRGIKFQDQKYGSKAKTLK